jgi:general secretion pathway protein G
MLNKKIKLQQGFTLIELLIVMAIIGMLAALVGPKVIGAFGKAQKNDAAAQISMLDQALDSYRLDVGKYPKSLEGLLKNDSGRSTWAGPYLKKNTLPKDAWKNDYQYQRPGKHNNEYDLYSYGADGQQGGDGDDADIVNW